VTRPQLTLRDLRTQVLGLTQARFAADLGVSRRTLMRYEMAGSAPTPILRLAGRIAKDKFKKGKS